MTKAVSFITAIFICTSIFGLSDYTTLYENNKTVQASSWYTMPKKDGTRPDMSCEISLLEKYNAYCIGEDEKVLYLTFDAGYSNENVLSILNTLKEKNVKASFFLNGGIFKYESDAVLEMSNGGHCICNHTENHKSMDKVTDENEYRYEIEKIEERYKNLTGKELTKCIRPPKGEYNEESVKRNFELGYKTVFWSVAYADWDNNKQPSEEYAIKTLTERIHNGAIILLHPTSGTNAKILGTLIDKWTEMGYTFKTVDMLPKYPQPSGSGVFFQFSLNESKNCENE